MPLGAALWPFYWLRNDCQCRYFSNRRFWRYDYYGVIVILTWALTQVMSNTAACNVVMPVGDGLSHSLLAQTVQLLLLFLLRVVLLFALQMAIPANSMIIGPGNVKFKDFKTLIGD